VAGHMATALPSRVEPKQDTGVPQPPVGPRAASGANTEATGGDFARAKCVDCGVTSRADSRDGAQADHRVAYRRSRRGFGPPDGDERRTNIPTQAADSSPEEEGSNRSSSSSSGSSDETDSPRHHLAISDCCGHGDRRSIPPTDDPPAAL
jgi:hypothetical protein